MASESNEDDIYEEDFLKSSGLVQESLEKKSPSPTKVTKSGDQNDALKKFNSPLSGGLSKSPIGVQKPSSRKDTESIQEEEVPEEDYNEDDFEQDSQKSNKNVMHGTLS